jgi:hypothetical protein
MTDVAVVMAPREVNVTPGDEIGEPMLMPAPVNRVVAKYSPGNKVTEEFVLAMAPGPERVGAVPKGKAGVDPTVDTNLADVFGRMERKIGPKNLKE